VTTIPALAVSCRLSAEVVQLDLGVQELRGVLGVQELRGVQRGVVKSVSVLPRLTITFIYLIIS